MAASADRKPTASRKGPGFAPGPFSIDGTGRPRGYKEPVSEVADELFTIRPAEFVKARDALAKRLTSEGRGDEAKAVKALRRPSTPVWALNQLGRRHRAAVDSLLRAGAEVREAQKKGAGAGLREANDALQRQVLELVRLAEQLVVDEGVAASAPRRELETAIRTVAVGGGASETFRDGRLAQLPEGDEMDMWSAGDGEPEVESDEADTVELEEARDVLERAELEAKRARELVEDLTQRVEELEEMLRRERADLESATRQAGERTSSAEKAADRLKRLQA